jgi:hypothetical protein
MHDRQAPVPSFGVVMRKERVVSAMKTAENYRLQKVPAERVQGDEMPSDTMTRP